jgi:kynurenine formamidase
VVDLTAPLSQDTPVIQLPPPFANTAGFSLQQISRYDEKGPAWYWNNIAMGEHAGTHFDAPVHWITGRDGLDVSQIPVDHLVAPAVVVDKSVECSENPDFLLEVHHLEEWQNRHGPLPAGGWLLYRTGWDSRAGNQDSFLNADETGPAYRSSAPAGLPTASPSSESGWRQSAPTRAPLTASTRRFPAIPFCWARGSTA